MYDLNEANKRISFLEFILNEKEKIIDALLNSEEVNELIVAKARIANDKINKLKGGEI
jgi:hypothetical protein